MQDQPTVQVEPERVTMTAACEIFGTHRCSGRILSLTDAHLDPCQCPCHQQAGS